MNTQVNNEAIKVLFVEDNPGDVRLLQEVLKEASSDQFDLISVGTLTEAIARLAENSIDVILLDLSLPDASGRETLMRMRAASPYLPIVILTGNTDEALALQAVREGAQDYLLKNNLDSLLLKRVLRNAIERKRADQAQRENEERFRALVQYSTDIITILAADGKVLYESPSLERVMGYKPEAVEGLNIADVIHPDDLPSVLEGMQTILAEPAAEFFGEIRLRHSDGSWLTLETRMNNLLDHPAIHGLVVNSRDVTERRRNEEAIRFQAELLKTVGQAVIATDLSNKIIYWNRFAETLYGWSAAEALGRGIADLTNPATAHEQAAEIMTHLRAGRSWHGEFRVKHRDGTIFPVMVTDTPIFDEKGAQIGIIGVSQDITERKAGEDAVRQSEQRFRSLFEHSPISLWLMDYSGTKCCLDEIRALGVSDFEAYFVQNPQALQKCIDGLKILDVNRASLALYQAPDQETFRQKFQRAPLGNAQEVARRFFSAVANGQTFYHAESVDLTLDGTVIDVDVTWTVIPGFEGTLEKIIRSAVDITERKRGEQALKQSEQRFRSLFENSPLSLWEQDYSETKRLLNTLRAQGVIDFETYFEQHPEALQACVASVQTLDVNQATLTLYRAPDKQTLLKNWLRSPIANMAARTGQFLAAVAAGQTSYQMEFMNEALDGSLIELDVTWAVVPGFEDTFAKVIRSVVDITERKRGERALHQYNRRLEVLHNIDRDILTAQSPQQVAERVAQNLSNLVHCDAVRIIALDSQGKTLPYLAAYPPANQTSQDRLWQVIEKYGLPESFHRGEALRIDDINTSADLWTGFEEILTAQGARAWIIVPLVAGEQLVGLLAVGSSRPSAFTPEHFEIVREVADQLAIALHKNHLDEQIQEHARLLEARVTERTEQLGTAKERSDAILMSASDTMMVANLDGSIEQVNTAFTALFGYTLEQGRMISLFSLLDAASADPVRHTLDEVIRDGQAKRLELVGLRQDGTLFDADVSLSRVEDGQPITLICSIRDITERKRSEVELRRAWAKEKELNEIKTSFVSMVSHDFRTPLASIQSSSDLLQNFSARMTDDKKRKHFGTINGQIKHMTGLLEDMLTVTQADSVGLPFHPKLTDLGLFCQTIADEMQALAGTRQIHFSINRPGEQVSVDLDLLRRALINLLSNAVKYSPEKGVAEFSVLISDEQIEICVKDQGIGIPEADQVHLFEVFHRAKNVGQISGTGLGLAIVKRSVDAHGGTLAVQSEVGMGSAFTIFLPRFRTEGEAKQRNRPD